MIKPDANAIQNGPCVALAHASLVETKDFEDFPRHSKAYSTLTAESKDAVNHKHKKEPESVYANMDALMAAVWA